MTRRLVALLALGVLALTMSAVASAYVIASTPLAAARMATEKHAAHEVTAWNQPQVAYTMGTCRVLHRKPYLAYECGWKLHGVPDYCQGRLVAAVRKLADGRWRATGVKSFYIDNRGC
jgi:ketosteroid isomerase-like protein